MSAEIAVPYDELDPPVVRLCRAINALPGVQTIGSCGGHEEGGMLPANQWSVGLYVEQGGDDRPTYPGWLSLEFLAWAIRDFGRAQHRVQMGALSVAPYLNEPGRMLTFIIEGWRDGSGGVEADYVADGLGKMTDELFREYALPMIEEYDQ